MQGHIPRRLSNQQGGQACEYFRRAGIHLARDVAAHVWAVSEDGIGAPVQVAHQRKRCEVRRRPWMPPERGPEHQRPPPSARSQICGRERNPAHTARDHGLVPLGEPEGITLAPKRVRRKGSDAELAVEIAKLPG